MRTFYNNVIVLFVFSILSIAGCSYEQNLNAQIQPVPRCAVLQEDGYIVWGASMVRTDDDVCHLFYCRWKGNLGQWTKTSEIVYATSNSPLGPFEPQKVILGREAEGEDIWYGVSSFNPTVQKFGDKYYLYYVGSNGSNFPVQNKDGVYKTGADGNFITQRIGVVVADNPAGPWRRIKTPLVDISDSLDSFDCDMTCNPTVTQGADGKYLMVYKCSNRKRGTGDRGIYLTTATSDSPTGPFKKSNSKICVHPTSSFAVEDPFVWYQDGMYWLVVDDQRGDFSGEKGLIQFQSKDGVDWERSENFVVCRTEIEWEDGRIEKTHHLERPQIWLNNGKPAVLYAAVSQNGKYYNVHIPLQPVIKISPDKETFQR
ncbi:MAG: glycoside hydrolase family protein [Anaerohalosphaera sp.]|nr:glycoside hydrolase family protein [Anaerohalosphaera sp.]